MQSKIEKKKDLPYCDKQHVSKCAVSTNGLFSVCVALLIVSRTLGRGLQVFVDKIVSSMQTTVECSNLLMTKATVRWFSVQHCVPLCDQFLVSVFTSDFLPIVTEETIFSGDQWLLGVTGRSLGLHE